MDNYKRIGDLLLDAALISQEQLEQALKIQVGGDRRLGRIFLQMRAITNEQLVEVLSKQLGLPVTNVDEQFRMQERKLLPRYLCRRYGVLPLNLRDNNVLSVAMVDPSDTEAIRDIERYTGKAVHPCLAKPQDIAEGIKRHIPLSLGDLRNPSTMATLGKAVTAVSVILICIVSVFSYKFYMQEQYGSISRIEQSILYKNNDLIVGFDHGGDVTLLGRGAYANGYYSITFNSTRDFLDFVQMKKSDFSDRQFEWIHWTVSAKR